MIKLYHYVHCPFCVRVRMGLGLLKINYQSEVLPYHDEATPVKLTGVKMLPIIEVNQKAQNESLDIIRYFDDLDTLNFKMYERNKELIDDLLKRIGSPVHSLCMPYWIWTPEFNDESRAYFKAKKEQKRGPFKQLVADKEKYVQEIKDLLNTELSPNLMPFYQGATLSIVDIMIAAHLWGLYIVPEFQFDPEIHNYLQMVKLLTKFNYHEDFWR